ncbi:hypothetical protein AYI68_g5580 [Smittium mucronatum]|uniref:Uncharacterized protein n=1 Tax=Smittium mucronatum TaxID=133383 RepID=A0A1R0GTW2_9FUNG|nr:hypothetical protein AYI68_g5580 [Smittium mucronatum]
MVMRNHEFVESGVYPYGFATKVESWIEVAEDGESDALASSSIEALVISGDLDPSVDLAGKPVLEDIVSSLLGLTLGSGHSPPVRFSTIIPAVGAVQTLIVVGTGSKGRSVDRRSKGEIPDLKSLKGEGTEWASHSALSFASTLTAQQQFRSDDLYLTNWYKESASDTMKKPVI